MKKIISFIIACVMTMSLCSVIVHAADSSVEVTYVNDAQTGIVTINAKVLNARGAVPLVLTVEKGGAIIFADYGCEANNEVTFSSFRFLETMTGGEYTFTIYAEYIDKTKNFTINHISNEDWFNIITEVRASKTSYDTATDDAKQTVVDAAVASMNINIAYTNEDPAKYDGPNGLSPEAKELVALSAMNGAYATDFPADWTSPTGDDVTKLAAAVNTYKAACTDGMILAELYDCYKSEGANVSKEEFDTWFAANKTALSLEADNSGTSTLNEATFMTGEGSVFPEACNALSFYNKLPAAAKAAALITAPANATSAELTALRAKAVQKGIVDACILSYVYEPKNSSTVGAFIERHASYIGINYGTANTAQKSTAHSAVAGMSYNTLTELATAVKRAIPTGSGADNIVIQGGQKPTTQIGGNPGVVTGVVNNGIGAPLASNDAPFEDLEGYDWAKDAIDFLYRRSIISGRDAKTYDPAGLVTRAEFIKMLVATYNFAVEDYSDYKFNDIVGSEWFAIYVKKAAAMGIITGDENGNFNPDRQITRQDMAVTVYRASKFPESTEGLEFVDSAQISDYAKSAVACLYDNKIVSGMGDMVFAPLQNVTRAQAAQILYNVLAETIK